ncbi:DUF342 domain-containing protein [Noviherbaspirillum sp. UKPF54]|uniref:DUF342 domain-containing protein n=1 Tax=Noviherbaspirillum sp. UKPF54 TaxID=2601898 RepID=UPI0011B143DF|nr:FapA family protein [Noviherbaspirillum sp. UKPF54]QDZ28816.1 DUF342 domain-containing protein [Noviherbaspirillum sp. UKPF54]
MAEMNSQSLLFSLNEEKGELHVWFNPASGEPVPDAVSVRQALSEGGWGGFYLDEKAIDDFVASCRDAKEQVERVIGARRDGEYSLTVDGDLMAAWLTLVPPQGGKAVTREAVDEDLRRQGIIFGILPNQLAEAFTAGYCSRVAIARGIPPQEGIQTHFERLYDKEKQSPDEDDLERVKYADLCHLQLVQPGDKLMRREPPIPGKNGTNIKGQPILPRPTPDIPFRVDLQGASPDQNNPNVLVATTGGQPTPLDDGVTVNPVIEVLDVDLSTGSIAFEGTLHVGGDIKAGMHIKVSGDVIVNGVVEAAQIHAGGNVAVRGGVMGHPDSRPGSHALPETTARIYAGGTIQALFMENVHAEAAKSILLGRSARQCELIAGEEIVVGKAGSRSGQIMGGQTQATMRVATGSLGASTGMKTYVQVGIDPYLEKQIADKELEFKRRCDEVDRVVKLLTYFKQNPQKGAGGVAEKVDATRRQLLAEIDHLTAELKALRAKVELAEQATVEVASEIFYGVEVRIAQQCWQVPDDMGGAKLELQGGRIVANK